MGQIVAVMSVSVDGFMEGSNREIDWALVDEEVHSHFNEVLGRAGTFLEGRVTYLMMAEFWPTADSDPDSTPAMVEFASIWRDKPKVVFSTTLEQAGWDTTIMRTVDPETIRELQARYEGDVIVGGGDTVAAFLEHDLIDEFRVYVHPVAIGAGKPFFPPGRHMALELIDTHRFGNGVVLLHYRRATHP
jgi:dihydrofolate reductase